MSLKSKPVVASALIALGACCVVLKTSVAQSQEQSKTAPRYEYPAQDSAQYTSHADPQGERKAYGDKIRKTYDFRFGLNDISTPGNAATEGNEFISPGSFPKATYCAVCHEQAYSHWRQALHSNSFRTPFYRTSVNILRRTKGIEFTRHCESCHNPVAIVSGGITQNSQVDRGFDQDGLTCVTCHAVQKLQPTVGNGGYVLGVPSVMVDEEGNRIPGEVPYEEIMVHPERHSKAVMKDFYRTPEFCAACHKANLPQPLNDYKFVRAFTVYDEWHNSKFSKRNPLTFYAGDFTTCQNCHMARSAPELPEYGAKNGTFASHRWAAGNTAVPFYYGFDEQFKKTVEFLQSGNYLNVDLFAIKKNGQEGLIAPLGSVPFTLKPNDTIQTLVVIQNKNIGHSLVPEVRDLYEPWVEFTVKQNDGSEIYHSGFLKPDGSLDTRAHSFTNRPVDENGIFVDNHRVFAIHSVAYDNTIQAGRSSMVRYEFKIPADAKGPLTVTARVNYRHLRQSYLNNIFGKDHPEYPVIEIASRSRTFNLGDNAAAEPDPKDNPDWMRWNNYGIASLDQLQYAEAVDAFNEVVRIRPDYADGFTNIGLTEMEWEKYGSARGSLHVALSLANDNARALYYMALIERRSGHPEAEIADLKKVVAQYPLSRDARRELGKSYYREGMAEEAVEQFEALQVIDPDDVTAHYNLSILYARLGKPEKAAEQTAQFKTKKLDPGAPTYSLDFLLKHPEISTESVPWHMHTDLSPESAGAQPQSSPVPTPAAGKPAKNYAQSSTTTGEKK